MPSPKKNKRLYNPKSAISKKEKRELLHYRILIGSGIVFFLNLYLEPETLGGDSRWTWYIDRLPVLIGLITLGIHQRKFILKRLFTKEKTYQKLHYLFILLLQGLFFSYLGFRSLVGIPWNIINNETANLNNREAIYCEITSFQDIKRGMNSKYSYVNFIFQNYKDHLKVRDKTIVAYINKSPENCRLKFIVRKGIWDHYVISDWDIEEIPKKK